MVEEKISPITLMKMYFLCRSDNEKRRRSAATYFTLTVVGTEKKRTFCSSQLTEGKARATFTVVYFITVKRGKSGGSNRGLSG